MNGKPIRSAMKLSPVITPRGGLRFAALLVMCCAILAHISAMPETPDGQHREDQGFNGVSADGAETGELKQSLLYRERRASKTNTTPRQPDFEKRLKALEERLDALLRLLPRARDSYSSLLIYLLEQYVHNGAKVRRGPPGPPGKPGPTGKSGPTGRTGSKGEPGQAGKTGAKGKTGLTGAKGEPGKPGTNKPFPGPPGPKGARGAVGRTGAQGPQGAKGEKGQSGVKYVRWGRTTCPSGAQIVYKGVMGGEWYRHPGGGTNYLCLPHNPKYDKYKDGHQVSAYIYGTEYRVGQYNGDPFKKRLNGFEAPCVVCFVKSRGSMLMMPARNDCPSGWTEEYHGYLMTEYFNHKHSRDFICVDGDPEYVSGTHRFENYSALLYPVEGRCGSLPCLPYVAGRELTCAVCTK